MIATVTTNPCIDVEKEFDRDIELDGTNKPVSSEENPGGKGIDVSRAILACRGHSVALGFVGGHTGKRVRALLAGEDIETDFVDIGSETRTNIILHVRTGERSAECRVNSEGPEVTEIQYFELRDKIQTLRNPVAGAICGSVPRGLMKNPAAYNALLRAFKTANPECITYLDTGPEHTLGALQSTSAPDYIKPNIEEFNRLLVHGLGEELLTVEDRSGAQASCGDEERLKQKYCGYESDILNSWPLLLEKLRTFAEWFKATTVLVSMSELGVLTYSDGEFVHCYYSAPIIPKTFVGAGDSFLGGFIVQRTKSVDMLDALKAGVATSVARLEGGGGSRAYIDHGRIVALRKSPELYADRFKESQLVEHWKRVQDRRSSAHRLT